MTVLNVPTRWRRCGRWTSIIIMRTQKWQGNMHIEMHIVFSVCVCVCPGVGWGGVGGGVAGGERKRRWVSQEQRQRRQRGKPGCLLIILDSTDNKKTATETTTGTTTAGLEPFLIEPKPWHKHAVNVRDIRRRAWPRCRGRTGCWRRQFWTAWVVWPWGPRPQTW
jgi:hypothetical protein